MQEILTTLIDRLDSAKLRNTDIIEWSCPIPVFGNIERSRVATLGINPSCREFMDESGVELRGSDRRFHTLSSLALESWLDASSQHLDLIWSTCIGYFSRNPYERWFNVLDRVISGTSTSYYSCDASACHLDVIPYATENKWTLLKEEQKKTLLEQNEDILGRILRDSPVRILVLNGKAVVSRVQSLLGYHLDKAEMPMWALPRSNGGDVVGYAYEKCILEIGGVNLDQPVLVLGFNHNLQSSFGVTREVTLEIKKWIEVRSGKFLQ